MKALKVKSLDMLQIEKCLTEIKQKQRVEPNLRQIEVILKRAFNLDTTIRIVDNETDEFFGMSIYPSKDLINTMVNHILNPQSRLEVLEKMWVENTVWYLEIDSILLFDTTLNANPAEITAVLLHEIGHTVYSNSVPQRVHKVMRYALMDISYTMKKLIQWEKAQRIFDLVFVEACSSKNYHYINLHVERQADKFVVKTGYGDNLNDFIDKLLTVRGNRIINRTENDMEQDVKSIVNWGLENVAELEFRKTKLKRTLQAELLRNPSIFVRYVVKDIKEKFFGPDADPYTQLVSEQYLINEQKRVVKEGLLSIFDKNGKVNKIKQVDIDILSVEVGRIETEDDKIYVLDLVYDKLDLINASLELIHEGKKDKVGVSKDTLMNYKKQLEKIRSDVLAVSIKDKGYGLFIKYPAGFEG